MRRNPKWLDVDWVQLGCYGWEIDESGAEAPSTTESDFMHLDRTTLHIVAGGSARFFRDRMSELLFAGVPNVGWPIAWSETAGTTTMNLTANSAWPTTYLRLTG